MQPEKASYFLQALSNNVPVPYKLPGVNTEDRWHGQYNKTSTVHRMQNISIRDRRIHISSNELVVGVAMWRGWGGTYIRWSARPRYTILCCGTELIVRDSEPFPVQHEGPHASGHPPKYSASGRFRK